MLWACLRPHRAAQAVCGSGSTSLYLGALGASMRIPSIRILVSLPRPSFYPLSGPKYPLLGTIYPNLKVQGGSWFALVQSCKPVLDFY